MARESSLLVTMRLLTSLVSRSGRISRTPPRQSTVASEPPSPMLIDPKLVDPDELLRSQGDKQASGDPPAWKRLISYTLTTDERISLIATIFSDHNQVQVVKHLSGHDAQIFIDTIDEVSLYTLLLLKNYILTST